MIAAVLAFGAFQQAQRQADASEEANRPWLSIRSVKPKTLDLSKDTVSLTVEIGIENVGNSPARQILWGAFIQVQGDKFGPRSGEEACRRVDTERKKAFLEDAAFPRIVEHRIAIALRPTNELVEQNEIYISQALQQSSKIKDRLRKSGDALASLIKYDVLLILVGCVTYVDQKDINRSTSFAFVLHPRSGNDGVSTFDMSAYPRTIDGKSISLEQSTEGSFVN